MILKSKRRHILIRMSSGFAIGEESNWNELRDLLLQFLGEQAFADAKPKIIKILSQDTFIMSCRRGSEDKIILALSFIKKINTERLGFYTLRTSGTIKSLIERNQEMEA